VSAELVDKLVNCKFEEWSFVLSEFRDELKREGRDRSNGMKYKL
jgi:hypothetical protein